MNEQIEVASQDAEALLIGRMINNKEDRGFCCDRLCSQHFFFSEHRVLFDLLKQFHFENLPSETHLLIEHLKKTNFKNTGKTTSYVLELSQTAPSSIHLDSYIAIVKDNWAKRQAFEAVKQFSAEISGTNDIQSFFEGFAKKFSLLSKELNETSSKSFAEVSAIEGKSGYLSSLAFRREYFQKNKRPFVDGVSTGYDQLDETIGGFGNSNLIILASRPGMGKTALALNFARRISNTHSIGFISLEMSAIQLYERVLSMESEVSSNVIREGRATDSEWMKIEKLEPRVAKLPIFVQEGGYFLKDLVTKTRYLKEELGIQVLFIDYLQLLRSTGENRLTEISSITRDLKNLAMELHIPIICLAQLSRKVEERTSHRPQLSDLRESGTIEQDADVVMFLLRNEYYDENDRPGEADLIVSKNRHGKTGEVSLYFSKKFAKFDPLINAGDSSHDDSGF